MGELETTHACHKAQLAREWSQYRFRVLDLSSPTSPVLREALDMPSQDEGVDVLARGSSLYYAYKRPAEVEGDGRAFVRYFIKQIDLSEASPLFGPEINVAGRLLALEGDVVYTRGEVYGEKFVETFVARARIDGERAVLEGSRHFRGRQVRLVGSDPSGLMLVTHGPHPSFFDGWQAPVDSPVQLSVLDVSDAAFGEHARIGIPYLDKLHQASAGRAVFGEADENGDGLVVFDTSDPKNPYPKHYFPTHGWHGHAIFDGDDIFEVAGAYGISRFSL
ncbi:MAG: hypothetical protein H0U74_18500 [Bradymonadaceae bacterium]|nr:hypothetical protein [Lujinxingiaceae bacterium]